VKFAAPHWLFGTSFAIAVAILLVIGAMRLLRATRRFGDEARVLELVTGSASGRRAIKGVALVLAVALAFLALAEPQYGRGTRLIPATNLDVVVVLDYSKSMFARDVKPSRIARAKSEVGRLIADLPGARFGAVAFAGQPMSFPLTSDGSAIAQFFRQLSPNDMPVAGTAIARALEAGRELLARDPLASKHRKVLLLVTDGEDLEGDPVSVAQSAKSDGISVHVVQIGGRTPEPLPEVNEAGEVTGWRTDETGAPITTELSAEGEAQLAKIAEVTHGTVVRSERGETGIEQVATSLKRMMSEELSEKVETVYADVYMYPLGLALLLLLVETFIAETRRRDKPARAPPPVRRRIRRRKHPGARLDEHQSDEPTAPSSPQDRTRAAATLTLTVLISAICSGACEQADQVFTRHVPQVDDAIEELDGGDASTAVSLLENYLATGTCTEGNIGTPEGVRTKPNASFDLGLALFEIAERFGQRFGDEEALPEAGLTPEQEVQAAQRKSQVDCALRIVRLIAGDQSVDIRLRARAHYLAGNLEFLRREYRSAVSAYDLALKLVPGLPEDAGDGIGRDAAYNRAIALRRIEEEENRRDAGQDGSADASDPPDGGQDSGGDGGKGPDDQSQDSSTPSEPDAGNDSGRPEPGQDGGSPPPAPTDAGAPPQQPPPEQQSPSVNQDERILDMLESAPTLQEHDAKNRALSRGSSGMVDK
jgi:Ca-activated chloride channel family protein